MANLVEKKKKKKKVYSSIKYTTGDIQKNIDHFNKMLCGKAKNTHTDGLPNIELQKAAEETAKAVGTFASQSPDGASQISSGETATFGGLGESMSTLNETKRYVRRYYIRPQNIFCSNKDEVLKALIDINEQNCTIYTLNNLENNNDVTKLTNKDIIYYYDDGKLYDKNHVKVMDYDLAIKHEENRDHIDIDKVSDTTFEKVYDDRLTDASELDEDLHSKVKVIFECPECGNIWEEVFNEDYFEDEADLYATIDECPNKCPECGCKACWADRADYLNESINNPFELDFDSYNAYGEKLTEGKNDKFICCICGEESYGYGNNPEPYMSAEDGKCCDACNLHFVIPARLARLDLDTKEE